MNRSYFFLLFMVVSLKAEKMSVEGSKEEGSKYLLVKIKDENENINASSSLSNSGSRFEELVDPGPMDCSQGGPACCDLRGFMGFQCDVRECYCGLVGAHSCQFEGKTYKHGERMPCDNCGNMGDCIDGQPDFCTKRVCDHREGDSCQFDGKTYKHGERMPCDKCNMGECYNGQPAYCTKMWCERYREEEFCERNGKKYKPGEEVPCNDCGHTGICRNGGVMCPAISCEIIPAPPCQDKPWNRKGEDYDYHMLMFRIDHELRVIHIGMKKYIAANKKEKKIDRKFKQLKKIDKILSKIKDLPKSANKCMLEKVGDIMAAHEEGNVYHPPKILPCLEKLEELEKYLQVVGKTLPCQDKPWKNKSDSYDYSILKAKIDHAINIMYGGIKNYLGKPEAKELTEKQVEEKLKQLKRIDKIGRKIEKLPKSAKECMREAIGEILGVPRSENSYDLGKMQKS